MSCSHLTRPPANFKLLDKRVYQIACALPNDSHFRPAEIIVHHQMAGASSSFFQALEIHLTF